MSKVVPSVTISFSHHIILGILTLLVFTIFIGCSFLATDTDSGFSAHKKYRAGDYDGAIKNAKETLKIDPSHRDAWYWLARSLYAKDNHDEALEAYQKVIELSAGYDVTQLFNNQVYGTPYESLTAYGIIDDVFCAYSA